MYAYVAAMVPGLLSGTANEIDSRNAKEHMVSWQKDKKPRIDNVVCHYLDGKTLKNALKFIDYVRASKMKIKWSAVNVWSVRFKGKHVLDIIVSADSWRVRLNYSHMIPNYVFSNCEMESIKALIGKLRNSMPEHLEHVPAMS